MSNNKKFVNPKEAIIMGSFLRYEPARPVLGGFLPAIQREVLILCWSEEGRVREGTLTEKKMFPLETTLAEIREGRTAGDVAEIPENLRVWHGPPDRSGEQFVEANSLTDKTFTVEGEVVGEFLRFVPISKSGKRKPRLMPFVVVRAPDGGEIIARIANGDEWETSPGPMLPQLLAAHKRLMSLYGQEKVRVSPFGRGGYWQVAQEAVPLEELAHGLTEAVVCATT